MPKQKQTKASKPSKPKSRKNASRDLLLYILAGFFCIVIIWLVTRPQIMPVFKKEQVQPRKQETPAVKPDTKTTAEPDLAPAIISALNELGITDQIYKRSKKGNTTTFQAPLDKSTYDLFYANLILKGRVEQAGGVFTNGVESKNKQSLEFALPNNEKTWKVELFYDTRPSAQKTGNKTLAIVVDDFGEIGGSLLDGFLNLPAQVTFAIMPGFKNSVSTMERAHAQGRESIIHVPMEPIGYPQVNPGKNAILVQMSESEISKLLNRLIDQMPLCIGINNHMGSLATSDPDVMANVMKTLKARNKLFLDSRTTNVSVAYQEAQKAHVDAFRNGIFLDSPDISNATMESKIKQLETMSQSNPHIVAITHCHNQNKLTYLVQFIDRMRSLGYTLVPLSRSGLYEVPPIL